MSPKLPVIAVMEAVAATSSGTVISPVILTSATISPARSASASYIVISPVIDPPASILPSSTIPPSTLIAPETSPVAWIKPVAAMISSSSSSVPPDSAVSIPSPIVIAPLMAADLIVSARPPSVILIALEIAVVASIEMAVALATIPSAISIAPVLISLPAKILPESVASSSAPPVVVDGTLSSISIPPTISLFVAEIVPDKPPS